MRRRQRTIRAGGEDGFLLIEVLMSAVIVALIVTATFTGLDVATRLSAEQRHRNQAELLAAQSQEQMRSEPAAALDELVSTPHTVSTKINGVTYKVVQEAVSVAAGAKKTGCAVTEATASTAANFRVTSVVTWALQEKNHRPPVKQSGVISPPTGSGIEVDVVKGNSEPVSGVTARATFIPNESGSTTTIQGTTTAAGCVVLGGIQATEATVELLEKPGYVLPNGTLTPETRKLTIAPNVTTHTVYSYAEGGAIRAKFTYGKATTWEGKEVKGDTFVVANPGKMGTAPEYEVGSTEFKLGSGGEEQFEALTSKYANNASFTAKAPRFLSGDLFPFSSAWTVYAGDCPANKTSAEVEGKPAPVVTSGTTQSVEVPLAVTKLSLYTGTGEKSKGELYKESLKPAKGPEVTITNNGCASEEAPNNSTGLQYVHTQNETLPGSTKGGQLENPFQPSGTFTLCMVYKKQTYSIKYTNSPAKIAEPTIYLGQRVNSTIVSQRVAKEAEYKAEEPYKARSTAGTEAEADKAKATGYETAYKKYEGEYKTAETEYKNYETKYKAAEIEYKNYETKYKAAEIEYKSYETKYKTAEANYKNFEAKYKTEKANWEAKKVEPYKKNWLKYEAEYETEKANYNTYKGKYEAEKANFTTYKGKYETEKANYNTYKTKYETEKTNYNTLKGKYEAEKTNYNTYANKYKTEEFEYESYLGYKTDKAEYETLVAEEKEAEKAGVTVVSKEEC